MNLLIDTRYLTFELEELFGATNWNQIVVTEAGKNLFYGLEYAKEDEAKKYPSRFFDFIIQLEKENLWLVEYEDSPDIISKHFSNRPNKVKESIFRLLQNHKGEDILLFTEDFELIDFANKNNIKITSREVLLRTANISPTRIESLKHNYSICKNEIAYLRLYFSFIIIFAGFIAFITSKLVNIEFRYLSILYGITALIIAFVFYNVKLYSKKIWGFIEILMGIVNSIFIYNYSLTEDSILSLIFFQFIGGVYLITRGIDNIDGVIKNKLFDSLFLTKVRKIRKLK